MKATRTLRLARCTSAIVRNITGNTPHFARTEIGFGHVLIALLLACRLIEAKISCWVALKSLSALRSSALPRRVVRLALDEVVPRENRRGGLSYVVREADIWDCAAW